MSAADEPIVFKKPAAAKRLRRKPMTAGANTAGAAGGSDSESDSEARSTAAILEAKREEQKLRQRRQGLDVTALNTAAQSQHAEDEKTEAAGPTAAEDRQAKKDKIQGLLTGQFIATKVQAQDDDYVPFMEAYVNEKLGVAPAPKEEPKPRTDKEKLFEIPPELQVTSELNPEEDMGGAPVLHGTGIAEVELPLSYKLKNIEQTELARKLLSAEHSRGVKRRMNDSSAVGNVSVDYRSLNKQYKEQQKERRGDRDEHEGGGHHHNNHVHASDDQAIDRFRKQLRKRHY